MEAGGEIAAPDTTPKRRLLNLLTLLSLVLCVAAVVLSARSYVTADAWCG